MNSSEDPVGVSPRQRSDWQALRTLVTDRKADLIWYWKLGLMLRRLRRGANQVTFARRSKKVVGRSASTLSKAMQFAADYPTSTSVKELVKLKAGWARIVEVLAIPNMDDRHNLLGEAAESGWSVEVLRLMVRERFPTPRRGVAGRPRRELPPMGAESALRELAELTKLWVKLCKGHPSATSDQAWRKVLQGSDEATQHRVQTLLEHAEQVISEMVDAAKDAKGSLTKIIKRPSGRSKKKRA